MHRSLWRFLVGDGGRVGGRRRLESRPSRPSDSAPHRTSNLQTVVLSLGYWFFALAVGFLLVAVGFCLLPAFRAETLPDLLWGLLVRYGLGLGVVSGVVVWLGLVGGIRAEVVWPVLLALAVGGVWRARWGFMVAGPPIRRTTQEAWWELTRGERYMAAGIGVWLLLLTVNLLIGALAPDTMMDSMWYHLSVPGQWVITGRADTFPTRMPSNYPLGLEAVYAALLLLSDEILCTCLYAQLSVLVFAGMIVLTWRWAGPRAALWIAACVTFYTTLSAIAPVSAANDSAMALLLLLAFGELVNGLRTTSAAFEVSCALRVGFLLGGAFACKLIGIGFGLPLLLLFLGAAIRRGIPPGQLARRGALLAGALAFAYLPWAFRGLLGPGNPVFPLLGRFFPVREAYRWAYDQSHTLNALYPISPAGLREALVNGLPEKLWLEAMSTDVLFWLILMAGLALVAGRGFFWRFLAWVALALYGAFLLMKGHNEVVRYFSLSYPLAAPLVGRFLESMSSRLRPRLRYGLLVLLFAGGIFNYTKYQLHFAGFPTVQWQFRPAVTAEARRRYAAPTESGAHYLRFEKARQVIDSHAYVFVPQTTYIYYLKRRALWGLEDRWESMSPAEAIALVQQERFDYCLFENPDDPRVDAMRKAGLIVPVTVPGWEAIPWKLFQVRLGNGT